MMRILEERGFPRGSVRAAGLGAERGDGASLFRGEEHEVGEWFGAGACRDIDVAFVSIGATASRAILPEIAAGGTVCVDNSSAFRMEPDVPLAVPDVNPEALDGWPRPGIIAVPNCTTIAVVLALAPLHRAATCTSLVLSSYQAVSGAGRRAVSSSSVEQIDKLRGDEDVPAAPGRGCAAVGTGDGTDDRLQRGCRGSANLETRTASPARSARSWPNRGRSWMRPTWTWSGTSVRVPVIAGHAVFIASRRSPGRSRRRKRAGS